MPVPLFYCVETKVQKSKVTCKAMRVLKKPGIIAHIWVHCSCFRQTYPRLAVFLILVAGAPAVPRLSFKLRWLQHAAFLFPSSLPTWVTRSLLPCFLPSGSNHTPFKAEEILAMSHHSSLHRAKASAKLSSHYYFCHYRYYYLVTNSRQWCANS